jgi:hypothetical protein
VLLDGSAAPHPSSPRRASSELPGEQLAIRRGEPAGECTEHDLAGPLHLQHRGTEMGRDVCCEIILIDESHREIEWSKTRAEAVRAEHA